MTATASRKHAPGRHVATSARGTSARRRTPGEPPAPVTNPIASARAAGLRYVDDTSPGIRRRHARERFHYVAADGAPVRDPETLGRIRSLAIPPAWTDVWICPSSQGHVQATGRDAKGRKQYRYHPRWRAQRDENKYGRMIAFGAALPRIRARIQEHLALPGLPREKVLATVVRLLETTFIRVGNREYARENKSFGLTTMRDRHVDIAGARVQFTFRGKGGKRHEVSITDRRLARVVARCRDIPGYQLFQYLDDEGQRRTVESADVNAYLKEISGEEFTAKEFRTWAGTVLAAMALEAFEAFDSETRAKKNIVQAIESVAERLGNTSAVCRACYVHPAVLECYLGGTIREALARRVQAEMEESLHELRPEEAAVLELLRRRAQDP